MNGKLWVDEFVTHHRDLKEINEGFDDMHVSRAACLHSPRAQPFTDGASLWTFFVVWKLHSMCR